MAAPVQTGDVAPRPLPSAPQRALAQLRRTVDTAPGRLRTAGILLTVLVLAFGTLAAWQVIGRARAADQVVSHSQPLSQNAAEIYRSLADADATAASAFLLAGDAPQSVRDRYRADLDTAARLLTESAARTGSSDAQQWVTALNRQLPQYAGLVETAGADNRQGLPLGGAYLRYASAQLQESMLPAAQRLAAAEAGRLDGDYAAAGSFPWAALVLGGLALAALVRCQQLLFRRTNRVFNPGLLGATAAVLAAVLWLAAGSLSVHSDLTDSRQRGALPLRTLDQARIEALQSHTAENLDLVARGASDTYTERWAAITGSLAGPPPADGSAGGSSAGDGSTRAGGGTLGRARTAAPGEADAALVRAQSLFTTWEARHRAAAKSNEQGDYEAALRTTVGTGGDSAEGAFTALDQQLAQAATAERTAFERSAKGTDGVLYSVAAGAAFLAVLAAAGVVRGLGRRLAEYR
ncbi:hypothetical protein [Kitasatospora sp. GP82]|uniref:hypothetical protein n=1 Tax=Kitasatospora sp. GP82 TaxID=3035089 RepID=UPI0024734758|nr:hypothetical protein [Kitasatospora sp. GP82]MDH6127837.1 hypothetical protein [Kitasatospora sp. GP82]